MLAGLFGVSMTVLLGMGFVTFAAVSDYSNQRCWDFPDAFVGNCSDAKSVFLISAGVLLLSGMVAAISARGMRRV
jgi:hypothetical protein